MPMKREKEVGASQCHILGQGYCRQLHACMTGLSPALCRHVHAYMRSRIAACMHGGFLRTVAGCVRHLQHCCRPPCGVALVMEAGPAQLPMPRFSSLLRPSPGRLTPVPRGCPPCIPVDAGSLDVSSASPSPISHPRAAIVTIPAPRCTNELYRPTQGVRLTAAHTLLGSPAWVQTSDRRDFALQDIYERGFRRGATFYTCFTPSANCIRATVIKRALNRAM